MWFTVYFWHLCLLLDTGRFQYRRLAHAACSHCKTRENCSTCGHFHCRWSHCHIIQLSSYRGRSISYQILIHFGILILNICLIRFVHVWYCRHVRSVRRRESGRYPQNTQRRGITNLAWTFCVRLKITVYSIVQSPSPVLCDLFMGSKMKTCRGTSPCRLQSASSAPMWTSSFGDMASTACLTRMTSSSWSTPLTTS